MVVAARLRTLPAAVAPVLVGTALAGVEDEFHALRFVAALVGSIFIQVGTNLSNDYSDARRGADSEDRLGPVRVTAGGLMPPRTVLVGTYVAFGSPSLPAPTSPRWPAGSCSWWVSPRSSRASSTRVGRGRTGTRASVSCSSSFSSASSPWSAPTACRRGAALGGVRAVCAGRAAGRGDPGGERVRDIETDRRAGKRTLAVKLGRDGARRLFAAMLILAFVVPVAIWLFGGLSAWLLLSLAVPPGGAAHPDRGTRTDSPSLNAALADTGRLLAVFSLLLAAGVLLS